MTVVDPADRAEGAVTAPPPETVPDAPRTMLPAAYRNTYYALRHGISEANEQGIIVSQPQNGVPSYGLSSRGWTVTVEALQPSRLPAGLDPANAVAYTSDFKRAADTAEAPPQSPPC